MIPKATNRLAAIANISSANISSKVVYCNILRIQQRFANTGYNVEMYCECVLELPHRSTILSHSEQQRAQIKRAEPKGPRQSADIPTIAQAPSDTHCDARTLALSHER